MATGKVTVWVMPHDDPEVEFVVNTRSELAENFADEIDQENDVVAIDVVGEERRYDPSTVFRAVDPATWEVEFGLYCDSWTELDMPLDVFFTDDDDSRRAWIRSRMG